MWGQTSYFARTLYKIATATYSVVFIKISAKPNLNSIPILYKDSFFIEKLTFELVNNNSLFSASKMTNLDLFMLKAVGRGVHA